MLKLRISRYRSNHATLRNAASDECGIAAEQWARRTMWLLVITTSWWDIGLTFDRHLGFAGRLVYASLAR